MKIRLGGSRGKAGALYGIEQIRASGAYAITGGRRSEPRQLRPVNWSNCRAVKTSSRTRFFARQAARAKCKKSEVGDTYVCNNCRWRAGACVHRAAAGNHRAVHPEPARAQKQEACRGRCGIQAHRLRTLAGARRDYVGSTTFASAEHVGDGSPPRTGHPDRSPPSRCTNAAFRKGPQPCGAARTYFRSAFDGQCVSVSDRSLNAGKRARSPRVTGSAVACCDDSCPALAASRSRSDAPPGRGSKAARLAIGMSRQATMGVVEKPARRPERSSSIITDRVRRLSAAGSNKHLGGFSRLTGRDRSG